MEFYQQNIHQTPILELFSAPVYDPLTTFHQWNDNPNNPLIHFSPSFIPIPNPQIQESPFKKRRTNPTQETHQNEQTNDPDYNPPTTTPQTQQDEKVICSICQKPLPDQQSLKRHQARIHKNTSQKHHCKNCNGTFRTAMNLRRHINNAHTGLQNKFCKLCTATFTTERSLSLHLGNEHSDRTPEEGGPKRRRRRVVSGKVYECRLCDYKSDQRFNVTRHFKTLHAMDVLLFCPFGCGKVCKSNANLKTHTMSCSFRKD